MSRARSTLRRAPAVLLAAGVTALLLARASAPLAQASPGDPSPPALLEVESKLKEIKAEDNGRSNVIKADDPRFLAAVSVARTVGREGSVKAATALVDRLDEHLENIYADHAFHYALREGLVEVPPGSKGEAELLRRLKTDKAWTKQVALIWVTRRRPADAAVDAALLHMAKNAPKLAVQSAALKALGYRRVVSAVDDMIDLMDRHEAAKGRLWLDARLSLHELTGFDRPTAKAWRALWSEKKRGFDPAGGRGQDEPFKPALADSPGEKVVPGEHVVVAIDTSGSLHVKDAAPGDPIPAGPEPRCQDCGRVHAPGSAAAPPERVRLWREKAVCSRLLDGLRPKSTRFDIVRFDSKATSWQTRGSLASVSSHSIASAKDFLLPVEANGVTRMAKGIEESFAVDDLDVLYLITDGAPTGDAPNTADAAAVDEVVALTRVLNRFRGVRIYGMCFRVVPSELLKILAYENGGAVGYMD